MPDPATGTAVSDNLRSSTHLNSTNAGAATTIFCGCTFISYQCILPRKPHCMIWHPPLHGPIYSWTHIFIVYWTHKTNAGNTRRLDGSRTSRLSLGGSPQNRCYNMRLCEAATVEERLSKFIPRLLLDCSNATSTQPCKCVSAIVIWAVHAVRSPRIW